MRLEKHLQIFFHKMLFFDLGYAGLLLKERGVTQAMLFHKIGTFWRPNYIAKNLRVNPPILYKFSFLNLCKTTILRNCGSKFHRTNRNAHGDEQAAVIKVGSVHHTALSHSGRVYGRRIFYKNPHIIERTYFVLDTHYKHCISEFLCY